jgi:hypothetical protein
MNKGNVTKANSMTSPGSNSSGSNLGGWLKMGTVAAASALAGGLAAAWYYRKTLKALQEAESAHVDPESRIPDYDIYFDI